LKLQIKRIVIGVLGGTLLFACSTKKDAFVNRNWHALTTKYNVLYNGNIAFEEGREQLNGTYLDNYWEILPVERLQVSGEVKLDSEDNNPNFVIAEEKATKAIQKHGMEIEGEERNPQTDEAFLLLGKARYFDERYIPAIEAFNYILRKYPKSDKLDEASIWREKTNIRLQNEELAIKNLKNLLRYEQLKAQDYADAHAMMAQANINLKETETAVQHLKVASAYTKDNAEKGRYYFIIGQLFNQLGYRDSANYVFDKIIELNRKSPRVYMINAHLQKVRNTKVTPENMADIMEYLTDLEENRENRPFLDIIYHEIGYFHESNGSDSLALAYYNKSLRATRNIRQLNALNYEYLGEHFFDENEYKSAGAYYDSVLTNLNENTKKFRTVKKKLDNLEDVIKYEDIVQHADSVMMLYNMTEPERVAYFDLYIADLKRKAEEAAAAEEKRTTAGFAAFAETKGGQQNKGKFYFYNIASLGYGKNDFRNRWGDRVLEDDWRWANKNRSLAAEDSDEQIAIGEGEEGPASEEEKYSLDYYLEKIPTDPAVIDSLGRERNFANYQLGLIYKEKFKENLLAAGKLEDVLKSDPEERLILPSKYNLYKIYEESDSALAEQMKENIIQNHPESRYAEILLNPQAVIAGIENSPERKYAELFKLFEDQQFLTVITRAEENINQFTGEPIVPKFEMLKANAIGRLQGYDQFKEALNYVALNYPNNPEGKKAEQMIEEQLPKLEPKEFSQETGARGTGNWKVVFPFKRQDDEKAEKLKKRLQESMIDLGYKNVVSKDIYTLEDEFVVAHGFKSKEFALGYVELLKVNKNYRIDIENFVILSSNYKIIQVHKNIEEYKDQVLTPKP
jgi:hypothetical protein